MKVFIILFLFSSILMAKDITYKINGADYEGFLLKKSAKAPTAFIIHDWDGLTDYEKKRAEMLKSQGFSVFALDMFGKGVRPTEMEEKKKKTGELYADRKKMRELMTGAIDFAKAQGLNTEKSVIIGYCFGGTSVLELARSGVPMNNFISFHGGLATPEGQSYKETKGSVTVYHGTADDAVPMEDFASLGKLLEASKIDHEMISYGGAPHAFSVFGSERYRENADKKSWAHLTALLKTIK